MISMSTPYYSIQFVSAGSLPICSSSERSNYSSMAASAPADRDGANSYRDKREDRDKKEKKEKEKRPKKEVTKNFDFVLHLIMSHSALSSFPRCEGFRK